MSHIQIKNLSFTYEGSFEPVFKHVTLNLDTNWKLGLIGRNGKGKTTFLKLLQSQYEYTGTIQKEVDIDYFPFSATEEKMAIEVIQDKVPYAEDWEIIKELNLLNADIEILYRPFSTLSGGEKNKILLVALFLKENNFLLIDEPTNHLDQESRKEIETYLQSKKGFILVSHDRNFLDATTDHILAINNSNIEVQQGNYSSWKENQDRQNNFEMTQNEKMKKDIVRLEKASKETANWSNQIEKTKYGNGPVDRGFIGHKAEKMMKRSKVLEGRQQKALEEKKGLLKNIDRADDLTVKPLSFEKSKLIVANKLQVYYEEPIHGPVTFELQEGDRIALLGKNGTGKSSILKAILEKNNHPEKEESTRKESGILQVASQLKISYVSQDTSQLKGTLHDIATQANIDEGIFKAMLSKMGISSEEFTRNIENYSEGQKKKVLIARSITESAHLYLWDEPLNFMDIISREQIETMIQNYMPTMIFIEHDERFVEKIATKKIILEKV